MTNADRPGDIEQDTDPAPIARAASPVTPDLIRGPASSSSPVDELLIDSLRLLTEAQRQTIIAKDARLAIKDIELAELRALNADLRANVKAWADWHQRVDDDEGVIYLYCEDDTIGNGWEDAANLAAQGKALLAIAQEAK